MGSLPGAIIPLSHQIQSNIYTRILGRLIGIAVPFEGISSYTVKRNNHYESN